MSSLTKQRGMLTIQPLGQVFNIKDKINEIISWINTHDTSRQTKKESGRKIF